MVDNPDNPTIAIEIEDDTRGITYNSEELAKPLVKTQVPNYVDATVQSVLVYGRLNKTELVVTIP